MGTQLHCSTWGVHLRWENRGFRARITQYARYRCGQPACFLSLRRAPEIANCRPGNRVGFDANPELAGDFFRWSELKATTHQGPWFKACHYAAVPFYGSPQSGCNRRPVKCVRGGYLHSDGSVRSRRRFPSRLVAQTHQCQGDARFA